MNIRQSTVLALLMAASVDAFAPSAQSFCGARAPSSALFDAKLTESDEVEGADAMSLEQEVEVMVQKAMTKNKVITNLRNEKGIEYAPWMGISEDEENNIRSIMREKAEVRRRRADEELKVSGSLLKDSQFQELSGTGLRGKVVDGTSVELEWSTASERDTAGFVVKRRTAKTEDFETIASFESYGPLGTKGPDGGQYRYLDEDIGYGNYFYRITECQTSGIENDLSQCLVEVQTEEEQKGAIIAAAGFGVFAIAAVVAGLLLDPTQY